MGGVALASVLLASCSQEWAASDKFKFSDADNNPYAKGKAEMAGGRYGLAIESFRKALQSDPGSVKALNGLAAAYDLMGRFDLAERYYRLALNFDPSSIQSLNNLGYSYYLRGKYNKARTLFERAARVDGKNAIVVANMAALEKADTARQVADASAKSKAKGKEKSVATKWIERTDSQVQSMVTKPDPATLAAAQKHKVEPRIVHTPRPLIEIATAEPAQIQTVTPAEIPASVVAVNTGHGSITAEPKAPTAVARRTDAAPKTAVAMVATTRQPQQLEQAKPELPTVSVSKAATPAVAATTAPKMDSYALVAPSEPKAPGKPAATLKDTANLPALKDSVAQDVRTKQSGTKTAALDAGPVALPAQPDAEVPASTVSEVPASAADQPQKTAAVSDSTPPVLPDAPAPLPDTAQPALAVAPSGKAAKREAAEVPAAPAKPATTKAAAILPKAEAKQPMEMAALGATKEPTETGKQQGKLAGEEAAQELAALAGAVRIEISNGAGRLAMAARMSRYLKGHGAAKMRLTNAMSFTNKVSVLYFRPGQLASAKSLSSLLPVHPELRKSNDLASDLRLVLGGDLLNFDRGLIGDFR
jgi:tetratricopeptide (TPR) repeat protein